MLFERISRAIRASAIGDAVGYVFEFDDNPLPSEVLACAPRHKVISDDTQMTLFTLAALPGITPSSAKAAFTESYLQWLQTQDGNPNLAKTSHGLLAHPELYAQMFPGMTCLSALRSIASGSPVRNNSKGCGSVMRILPLLYLADVFDKSTLIQMAVDSAEVTHHHPANAVAVRQLMEAYYTLLLGGVLEPIDVTGMLGWTADECVDMAINAAATASDFDDLLVKSICHAGDSDSVAAVAAGLWGLTNNFPDEYYSTIKEKEVIEAALLPYQRKSTTRVTI